MICSSENLPLSIIRLLREVIGLYLNLEEFAGLRSLLMPRSVLAEWRLDGL